MDSQDLKTHQWKNRVILILSNDAENQAYKTQINDLKNSSEGCAERKLLMYQVLPNQLTTHHFKGDKRKPSPSSSDLYKEFMSASDSFKMILIGLDGGIKEKRNEPISSKELFAIIDGMSMRQAEIRKNN